MMSHIGSEYQFATADQVVASALEALRPPPDMTVSEWSDKHRRLSSEASASPGRFRTSVIEYMREPMDMVGKPGVKQITLMTSAQVGKSTVIENVIGYYMHHDPCPILHVSPTLDSMKMFSKERLAPMIRDTPVLKGRVKDARARDSGNTLASKTFPGGHIAMVGSNAPAGLASRPIRVLVADEVDRFELSAGTEGDPLDLAIKRTTTFWNRVVLFVSTPGDRVKSARKPMSDGDDESNKGSIETDSRIEKAFLEGDQRYRWCPCPHCGEYQRLRWANVHWQDNDPTTAVYVCEHNGCVIDDMERIAMVRAGEWRAEKPFNGYVSYHLSQLYSPFAMLADGVREFLEKKNSPGRLKTWVNTFLGEPWEEKGARLEWSDLKDQREHYDVPEDVTLITSAVDVQDDRFEIEHLGWGNDYQSWSLGYHVIYGDLSDPNVWEELRKHLLQTFMHPLFGEMSARQRVIDSGGHYTTSVYKFASQTPRTVSIKGVGGSGKPMIGRPTKNTIGGYPVVPLGVDTIKETVVARMKVRDPDKPGYCRWRDDNEMYGDAYFRGVTAEELQTKFRRGFKHYEWVKIRPRNEPFDVRVYNTAALEMLAVDLNAQRRQALRQLNTRDNEVSKPKAKPKPRKPRDNWATGWKDD